MDLLLLTAERFLSRLAFLGFGRQLLFGRFELTIMSSFLTLEFEDDILKLLVLGLGSGEFAFSDLRNTP